VVSSHLGLCLQGNRLHLVSCGHFDIQIGFDRVAKQPQVALLDMPSVAPYVTDDALCPGLLGQQSGQHGFGFGAAACLP